MDSSDALSRARSRERQLNKYDDFRWIPVRYSEGPNPNAVAAPRYGGSVRYR